MEIFKKKSVAKTFHLQRKLNIRQFNNSTFQFVIFMSVLCSMKKKKSCNCSTFLINPYLDN